jgi:hypothetical protein
MAISVEIRKEICLVLNATSMHLRRQAVEVVQDPTYADLKDMYLKDALDYEIILELFINGQIHNALARYWSLDTAARDIVSIHFKSLSAYETFLNQ